MTTTIQMARSPEELEALYSFRYRVYVEEMNRVQAYADHERKRIADPLDETAYNLIALDNDEIVGCVRVNFALDGGLDYYRDLLRMPCLAEGFPSGVSLCTRLMISSDRRGGSLATRLSIASFELGLRNRIRWNFIDCNDHLVPFFTRLGYRLTHQAVHQEYGMVNAMLLDLDDVDRLQRCNSPFLRSAAVAARRSSFSASKVAALG